MVGQTGVDKSHLAQALGHCAARQGCDVLFITQTELLKKLHAARATELYERKLQQFVRVPVLIVDDFALKPLRAPHDEDFHDLIAARYERAAAILTSNLDFSEWGDAFPGYRILGAATLDRLRHGGAYRVVIEGESFPQAETDARKRRKRGCKIRQKNAFLSPFEIAFRDHSRWPHYADP